MLPLWTKLRKARGIRSVFVGMNIWEYRVVGGGRMWWNTREWDGGVGEGCCANGCGVGGVTCGWRGGTLLQRGQMPHWLDFISHRQTPRSVPTSSVWARESVWTSQPVNLHQTRRAVTLSWWVPPSLAFFHCFSLFRNLCSRAHSPLQQNEKSNVRKREKESESETCEMKKEQRDIWLSVALLVVADVIRRDYRNTILSQITSPPLRLTAVSLFQPHVWDTLLLSSPPGHWGILVYTFSLWIISILITWAHVTKCSTWSLVHFPTYSGQNLPTASLLNCHSPL